MIPFEKDELELFKINENLLIHTKKQITLRYNIRYRNIIFMHNKNKKKYHQLAKIIRNKYIIYAWK